MRLDLIPLYPWAKAARLLRYQQDFIEFKNLIFKKNQTKNLYFSFKISTSNILDSSHSPSK
jgi:hypothetical protein